MPRYITEDLEDLYDQNREPRYIELSDYRIDREKKIVKYWLPAERIENKYFLASVTNIDKEGNLILHEAYMDSLLNEMNELIHENFYDFSREDRSFEIGDPCMAMFENDALYYRARITAINESRYSVEFIDYGNFQSDVEKCCLFKETCCSEIPQLAHRFKLYGSAKDSSDRVDQSILDKLHALVVDKTVLVVVDPKDMNDIKQCSISIDGFEINSYNKIKKVINENYLEEE